MADDDARRRELGRFLRAMRERLNPAEMGIAVSRRRRAPGLLREEVALAAGMSATWYTWLEQSRPVNPSPHALDGLARALNLNGTERAHLIRLARPDLEVKDVPVEEAVLSPSLAAFLDALAPNPAYAMNRRWDLIGWNRAAATILGDFDTDDIARGNVLARLFLDPVWRTLFSNWETVARSSVNQFRAATASFCVEPDVATFVQMMCQASSEFASIWNTHGLQSANMWQKTLDHPESGKITFDFIALRPEGRQSHITVSVYTPADDQTRRSLRNLVTTGE